MPINERSQLVLTPNVGDLALKGRAFDDGVHDVDYAGFPYKPKKPRGQVLSSRIRLQPVSRR